MQYSYQHTDNLEEDTNCTRRREVSQRVVSARTDIRSSNSLRKIAWINLYHCTQCTALGLGIDIDIWRTRSESGGGVDTNKGKGEKVHIGMMV